jgi:hypothetical protein
LALKFAPTTVSVNAGPPAVVELGDKPFNIGAPAAGGVMVKGNPLDEPAARLNTVIETVPGAAMSEAGISAIN